MHYFEVAPAKHSGAGSGRFTYHYNVPLKNGQLVEVPLGSRQLVGVVMGAAQRPEHPTKPITRALEIPLLPAYLLALADWLASFYKSSLGQVWQALLPAGLTTRRRPPRPTAKPYALAAQKQPLTPDQAAVLAAIGASPARSHLLQGVTGAGKTRIYIELIKRVLAAGRSALVLVPEISLTPQTMAVFEAEFSGQLLITHSGLTPARRHQVWLEALAAAGPKVVIGPRSALFLPLASLGIIVIDECHEPAYKQEQQPRYHAVTAAAKLADLTKSLLILGSATPALTDIYLAQAGKIQLHRLDQRINAQNPTVIEVVDMRHKELMRASRVLSLPLIEATTQALERGEQSLLFLNRRGTASALQCDACGWVASCPHCELPLTFHADQLQLVCHHCNHRQAPPGVCPHCQATELRYIGSGTKRIETEVERLFPHARVVRIDKDSTAGNQMESTYRQLHEGKVDIIIGTQMMAKGWDLPLLTTVGVVSADTMLYLPDFSAAERTFALLHQVIGRAGRRDLPGRVILQTRTPEHPVIQAAAADDFWQFVAGELPGRQLLAYPPYVYLLKLSCAAATPQTAEAEATQLYVRLQGQPGIRLVGPAPSFYLRQGGKYHWQILAKSKRRSQLQALVDLLPRGWSADLDPADIL